jgi:hypothetical protein
MYDELQRDATEAYVSMEVWSQPPPGTMNENDSTICSDLDRIHDLPNRRNSLSPL